MKPQKESTSESFCRASELWMESVGPRLKESSIVKYRNIIDVHLLPYFREMDMADITSTDILAFVIRFFGLMKRANQDWHPKQ